MKTPVTFSDEISPICVPPFTHMFHPDQKCWITGWGSSYKDGTWGTLKTKRYFTIEKWSAFIFCNHCPTIRLNGKVVVLDSLWYCSLIYIPGPGSDLLQEVEVTIMTSLICNRPMWYAGKITHRMFCAGHITGKADSCQVYMQN